MRSKWIVRVAVLVALVLAGVLVQGAWAGKFHFNRVTFGIGSLVMQGNLAGLGNETAEVTLTGYGTVKAMCQNKGGQQAPGRNPIGMNTQHTDVFVTDQYGHVLVTTVAPDPILSQLKPQPTPKQAGCPNVNWEVVGIVNGSTNWTAAKVVVKDEAGQVQIDQSYTCTTYFQNGVATDVACVET